MAGTSLWQDCSAGEERPTGNLDVIHDRLATGNNKIISVSLFYIY